MKIILDTNFLIDIFRFRIDLKEIDLIVPKNKLCTLNLVVKELKKISKTKRRDSKYAKLALQLTNKIKILNSDETNTDKAIIHLADKNTIVATNDAVLRKSLKRRKIKTIYLRAKKRLDMS